MNTPIALSLYNIEEESTDTSFEILKEMGIVN